MSAVPIGREGKGTPRRGVPAENEAVPGGGAPGNKDGRADKLTEFVLSRVRCRSLSWSLVRSFVCSSLVRSVVVVLRLVRSFVRSSRSPSLVCVRCRSLVRSSSCGSWFVVVFVEPGSFVRRLGECAVVGVGAFGCKLRELLGLPRRHVPQGPEGASGPQGKSPLFLCLFGDCVCLL